METEVILEKFGLSEKEARTYMASLELGLSTVNPIALRSGIKRTSIYNFIDDLVTLGIMKKTQINGRTYFQAESPHVLLEIQRNRLKSLENNLPYLLGLYNDKSSKPKISYYEGTEQLKRLISEILNCQKEVLYIWPGSELTFKIGGEAFLQSIAKERLEKKIFVRLVRFIGKEPIFPESYSSLEYLRENRWAPNQYKNLIDMAVAIYDSGKVGLFAPDKESYGLLIESKSFEQVMRMLFEFLWEKSEPTKVGEG